MSTDEYDLAWQSLDTYQPLGTLRPRSEFTNDLAYDTYLDLFNSSNYKSQIYNTELEKQKLQTKLSELSENIAQIKIKTYFAYAISAVIISGIVLGFILTDTRSRKTSVKINKETYRYVINMIIGHATLILGIIVFTPNRIYFNNHQKVFLMDTITIFSIGL